MSGHSKWSTIKRQKGVNDAKRGQLFTKLARSITIAAQKGGGDLNSNASLRLAIDKARAANMPKDNINRAINKGTGSGADSVRYEEITYEGYGPFGVAILVEAVTDNKNRTTSDIRSTFSRFGGALGEQGSARYIFGQDFENPQFTIPITDAKEKERVLSLLEALEDLDNVQEVYSNANYLS